MYTKTKKVAITLCFLVALCATNYAATITTVRTSKHLYQPAAKHMQKRLSCQVGHSEAMVQPYFHYNNAYASIPLSKNKWQSQLACPIAPSEKGLYTYASSLVYPWELLGTAHTKKFGRTHMPLRYKLGISAWIASVIIAQLYLNRAEASGHRGNGYRPYDCRWEKKFIQQAEKALEDAASFKRLHRTGELDKRTTDILGTSVLVALLWAQDQGDYLITKHYGGYFCNVMRSSVCYYYGNNRRTRDKYYYRLEREINTIRDLLGVPHPIGWEEQVSHFLYGGAKAGALVVTGEAIISAIPGLNIVAVGVGGIYACYKGIEWIDKNMVNPEIGLAEEEEYIKQELFVRALCADEASINQAQDWGGFVVTSALITESLTDGLSHILGEGEVFKNVRKVVTGELEGVSSDLVMESVEEKLYQAGKIPPEMVEVADLSSSHPIRAEKLENKIEQELEEKMEEHSGFGVFF